MSISSSRNSLIILLLVSTTYLFGQDSIKAPSIYVDFTVGPSVHLDNSFTNNGSGFFKTGNNYDFSAHYRIRTNSKHFIGAKLNYFNNNVARTLYNGVGGIAPGKSYDRFSMTFLAPSYLYSNLKENGKSEINFEFAVGRLGYAVESGTNPNIAKFRGSTIAAYGGAAYYFRIAENLFMGPKVSFLYGKIKNMRRTDPANDHLIPYDIYQDVLRFDPSLSIRFRF